MEVRREPREQGKGPDRRVARLHAGQQVERLLEEAEVAAEREIVDLAADHQDVDQRLAAREVRDHAGGERDGRLEACARRRPSVSSTTPTRLKYSCWYSRTIGARRAPSSARGGRAPDRRAR